MPYQVTWESPTSIWTKFSGQVPFSEMMQASSDLFDDPRSDGVEHAYWDFSDIDGFTVSEEEVDEIAYIDDAASRHMRQLKAAFVIRDPGLIELAEQYIAQLSALGSPWQNRIFQSMEEARQWTGSVR